MSQPLDLLYAGSLQSLLTEELFPGFTRLTGYHCSGRAGGSREWARQLRLSQTQADLLLSADVNVNEIELLRPGQELAEWYLIFATNELVLAYSDTSPAYPAMQEILASKAGWLQLLQAGYRLGRPDPEKDPKGYRTLFALQLAERHFNLPGLLDRVAGPPRNPAQLFDPAQLTPLLKRGELDLAFSYRSQAEEAGLPFIILPDLINLGSPALADHYASVAYQCDDGAVYRGAPIAYTATPLANARQPLAAAAFLLFLASAEAAAIIQRHGFRPASTLVRPRQP